MVEYSTWIGICYDVAKSKGYEANFENNSTATASFAKLWRENKQKIQNASKTGAEEYARRWVNVR